MLDEKPSDEERLVFVGDVKKPIWVGKWKDLIKMIDNTFYEIIEIYRWYLVGAVKIDGNSDYMKAIGIRTLNECRHNG